MARNIWQTLNDLVPDNPYYDDGEVSVGDTGITWDTGIGGGNGTGTQASWDNYLDLEQYVQDGAASDDPGDNLYNLDDFRPDSAIPWSWILGGGALLILFYAARR